MTLDEFLDDVVPNRLRPLGGWSCAGGDIRRYAGKDVYFACPLTAIEGKSQNDWLSCADRLGIRPFDAADIAEAADYVAPGEDLDAELHAVRARLLAGLGLQEG